MFQTRINQLGERLTKPLPGMEKFLEMAPENRRRKTVAEARARGCREGSVLLLLYPIEGVTHTVLTVRSASLRTHAGQISLPGGRIDPGEEAVEAALREAWEELDIMADQLEVLGSLSELYIPPSNYCLVPIVAATSRRPDFRPNEREVAQLLELPIDYFIGPTNRRVETWTIQGQPLRIPFFQYRSHKIWGATAMILTEMAALWEEIGDFAEGR
ncbi:MAG: NUDIX hydrolase [Ardenticatenaceae bacterium]